MKGIGKYASLFVTVVALAGLLILIATPLAAQSTPTTSGGGSTTNFNPPPCDFSDLYYNESGIDATQVQGRFGSSRQFGPPARSNSQANWIADHTDCSATDPDRRDFRILATTGGYTDDNSGNANAFISLLGFITSEDAFETTFSRTVGAINGGLEGVQHNDGTLLSITNSGNIRGIAMEDLVGNFEAYPATKQKVGNTVAATPCGSMFDPNIDPGSLCFSVASVATPNLREDWRFAVNRNAMDGSDGNCISNDPNVCGDGVNDAPFGYFCDDLLGMWINTYFWFTHHAIGNTINGVVVEQADPTCTAMLKQLASMNGFTTDGTPSVHTADELNFLEGADVGTTPLGPNFPDPPSFADGEGCMQEGNLDPGGADAPGAVWDICPAIPDPRNGAIAKDAFLDSVRFSNGVPLDIRFNLNFACLQIFGAFCSELLPSQANGTEVTTAAASN